MLQRWVCTLTAVFLSIGAIATAQDRATVQMRDGSKFEGRIEELTASGELFVRVSQHDQRRVPITSVALIDKVGGANGLPDTELREATGAQHLLLLSNGSSVKGHLVAIRGGEGSANENLPRTYVFRAGDGRELTYGPEQVGRVYLGTYPFAAITGAIRTDDLAAVGSELPGSLHIAARNGWVNTGLRVRKGEWISFSSSGQVQLSDNGGDRAGVAGTQRTAPGAPLPSAYAGALIGRVGNSQPFAIGDQAAVPMPFDGILSLAVNDDERADNAGEVIVSLRRGR